MLIILCFSLFSFGSCDSKNETSSHNDQNDGYYDYDEEYFDPDDFPNNDFNCTFPNTNRTEDGFCECIEGYSGDPYNPKGCYKCKDKCAINANCEYPGVCKCIYGYIGDGADNCELAIPHMLGITPNSSLPEGSIIINVSYTYAFGKPYQAYCRFGRSYVNHVSITDDIIQCRAPPRNPGEYEFSISVDEKYWSNEKVMFEYKSPPQISRVSIIPIILIYLGFLVTVSLVLYLIFGRKNNKFMEPTRDEKEPFLLDPERPKRKKRALRTRKSGL